MVAMKAKARIETAYQYGTVFDVWVPIRRCKTLDQAVQFCADEGYALDPALVKHLRTIYTVEEEEDLEYDVKF